MHSDQRSEFVTIIPLSIEKLSTGNPAIFQLRIFTGSPSVSAIRNTSEQGTSNLIHSSCHSCEIPARKSTVNGPSLLRHLKNGHSAVLSRLGQPDSIPALVLSSGSMAVDPEEPGIWPVLHPEPLSFPPTWPSKSENIYHAWYDDIKKGGEVLRECNGKLSVPMVQDPIDNENSLCLHWSVTENKNREREKREKERERKTYHYLPVGPTNSNGIRLMVYKLRKKFIRAVSIVVTIISLESDSFCGMGDAGEPAFSPPSIPSVLGIGSDEGRINWLHSCHEPADRLSNQKSYTVNRSGTELPFKEPYICVEPTMVVFLDLKAASDFVYRQVLWQCLWSKLLTLLKVLYANSRGRVEVYGKLSPEFTTSSGVRQGCPLSPFLFNFVIDTIMEDSIPASYACEIEVLPGPPLTNIKQY
ncbi:hypothetical protein T265_02479 [Opisthorchis viverrini]|uniref:Uncharacterized protein n=1 Tax=Opisthorchis viverrini TaxID=6198 RepID=A0A074ZV05_OPIVI|nr:hypothetical protein T265_02479 [Opisthorchis viverrini]KER31298.1 hypothetical protein T265_02479 [Opisthorchis viverrini]